jgi:hypothetical protein
LRHSLGRLVSRALLLVPECGSVVFSCGDAATVRGEVSSMAARSGW